MVGLRQTSPVPAKKIWLVRSWLTEGCYTNPIGMLNEVLEGQGREAYDALLAEIFRTLRKRLGVERGLNVHIVVRGGFSFFPYPAVREGEDSIQLEGNGIVHPLPKEVFSARN